MVAFGQKIDLRVFRKYVIIVFSLIAFGKNLYAQKNNQKIKSLVEAETYFSDLVQKKGINEGFIAVSDVSALGFKPNPVSLKTYYQNSEKSLDSLWWKPNFAIISKSGDFGFTAGPSIFTNHKNSEKIYGQYFSVWKSNEKNRWKLILDGGISHQQKFEWPSEEFISPVNDKYDHLLGVKKLKMRSDIVLSSDILFGKALKISGLQSIKEFYSANIKLFIADYHPKIGIEEVLPFISENNIEIESEPIKADGAKSGDIAYSYGSAKLAFMGNVKDYNYVRFWQKQSDGKWYVILDAYMTK